MNKTCLKNGDNAAFGQLSTADQIAGNYDYVRSVVLKYNREHGLVLTTEDCHDVASDVVRKALENESSYDSSLSAVKTYLFSCAHNAAVNAIKRKCVYSRRNIPLYTGTDEDGLRLRQEVASRSVSEDFADYYLTGNEERDDAYRRERVREHVVSMMPMRDQLVLYKLADGLSYKEIARDMEVKDTSVGKMVYDARRRARRMLDDTGYLDDDSVDFKYGL